MRAEPSEAEETGFAWDGTGRRMEHLGREPFVPMGGAALSARQRPSLVLLPSERDHTGYDSHYQENDFLHAGGRGPAPRGAQGSPAADCTCPHPGGRPREPCVLPASVPAALRPSLSPSRPSHPATSDVSGLVCLALGPVPPRGPAACSPTFPHVSCAASDAQKCFLELCVFAICLLGSLEGHLSLTCKAGVSRVSH